MSWNPYFRHHAWFWNVEPFWLQVTWQVGVPVKYDHISYANLMVDFIFRVWPHFRVSMARVWLHAEPCHWPLSNPCRFDVGSPSTALAPHQTSIGSAPCVCWVSSWTAPGINRPSAMQRLSSTFITKFDLLHATILILLYYYLSLTGVTLRSGTQFIYCFHPVISCSFCFFL